MEKRDRLAISGGQLGERVLELEPVEETTEVVGLGGRTGLLGCGERVGVDLPVALPQIVVDDPSSEREEPGGESGPVPRAAGARAPPGARSPG